MEEEEALLAALGKEGTEVLEMLGALPEQGAHVQLSASSELTYPLLLLPEAGSLRSGSLGLLLSVGFLRPLLALKVFSREVSLPKRLGNQDLPGDACFITSPDAEYWKECFLAM